MNNEFLYYVIIYNVFNLSHKERYSYNFYKRPQSKCTKNADIEALPKVDLKYGNKKKKLGKGNSHFIKHTFQVKYVKCENNIFRLKIIHKPKPISFSNY